MISNIDQNVLYVSINQPTYSLFQLRTNVKYKIQKTKPSSLIKAGEIGYMLRYHMCLFVSEENATKLELNVPVRVNSL